MNLHIAHSEVRVPARRPLHLTLLHAARGDAETLGMHRTHGHSAEKVADVSPPSAQSR